MLKTKPGYSIRQVLDAYLIMSTGRAAYRPNCIMSLNESGAFLWGLLTEGAEENDLVARMLAEYDVDEPTARKDVALFLAQLREKDLVTE